ncbi:hypothetical protein [Desulfatirhabdium butyrativorans]|uniref:hypothetical protein n=1 Tax=Desulfatirhabdium butyrativorans TaxID=340467 RepID=UPI0003FB80F6|nr:hypothetical protein [Desulfatirhabdium butyrativorans]
MLKTTIKIENFTCSAIDCKIAALGLNFEAPAYATGVSAVTTTVAATKATAAIAAIAAKYGTAVVVTNMGDFDDGEIYPYQPFILNKLDGDGAPGATDDESEGYAVGSVWIDVTTSPQAIYQCVDATDGAAVWKDLTLDDQPFAEKTPVNAVAASGTITSDATAPSDGDTVTIGTKTYTFKTALTPTEGQVLIGSSAAEALDNLKSAINHEGTPDTDYSCAEAHPTVTATTNTNTTQLVVAKTKGVAGNLIATTKVCDHLSWGDATLAGGVNGTIGAANETCADASYLYHCIETNTISDANWRRISLGSAY